MHTTAGRISAVLYPSCTTCYRRVFFVKKVLTINPELCIGCGHCIQACEHGARHGIDDTEAFFAALKSKERLVAIVAPAIAANFKGKDLQFNGWLKSIGVEAVFDVGFGEK